ncbi:Crp/Fnr family transcriptional regulator, partial [uncultured Eubacterium sp.]|uniref:Crp/Fnr family transcriptional regulator n=1 Tax=uncultured Eubacterium sp. TaxID=165185 RepID=UPI002630CFD3
MEHTLTQLPIWSSLTEQEQETLRRSAFVRHYEKGAFIHSSDTECLGMLFVLSGEIRAYLLSEEGREVTLFRLYPGELCVLSASCVISQITFDTQMTAGMDTDVLII